ncbi:S9 family peptidase [Galbibacter pacificus]|uniref:DPP IV N-terminal domain-containing protein n=1 Tax=Galbibacter pacificus TaxID=2996052 RepID=A0ABT6FWG6_9FLAO|nr:DPP IV N-terminal domain-containing protein [Galbibacter pacificus]MDG3583954.1 DPP IV N-terminal domain-containing protein [Galbibacter pacificus]MDG3587608.1 DPP IV N-terminal domain-containing protein [Galbibacter pacificus]
MKKINWLLYFFLTVCTIAQAQEKLTLDAIYNSSEYRGDYQRPISWISGGDAFVTIEKNDEGEDQLIKYISKNNKKEVFVAAEALTSTETSKALPIEDFTLSEDESKVLIFTNSSRVWRSNTKGDYWVYDFDTQKLQQIGKKFPSSSLMFAKFSNDNKYVAYVHDFNIYKEDFNTGEITQFTTDGTKDIINGTFDWVYEEEFGMRDGFSWSPDAKHIAFWQLDASKIGTFYMINNTDSIYSKPIPVQYPKVGQDPSSAKVAVVNTSSKKIDWIAIPGDPVQHYLPGMQWVDNDLLLIQQINRKQNQLNIYTYRPSTNSVKKIYTETEDTWVDIGYPDVSSNQWGGNTLLLTGNNTAFLRMTETDGWRHVYKVDVKTGEKVVLTPGEYDVASFYGVSKKELFFSASPDNPTQRYLYSVPLNGKGTLKRLTPELYSGINTYNIAPNGKYAIHNHTDINTPRTTRLISLLNHNTIITLVSNERLKQKLGNLEMPVTEFFTVTTSEGIEIDGRITKPANFDASKKYPVVFNVYGEPWGQMATDSWIGLYDMFLAQQGFVLIKMDNRGTPSLKGSNWRKSIYRKVGVVNTKDQALAAKEVLKWNFVDTDRISVWGWSGGGSMTLNLMFRYPEVYKTGIAVAAVANQLFYDNVYQERYMGLPQENKEDFIEGSPVTYAKNLEGNLLVVHGTGDDNVHYQNTEYLINELIRQNKQFDLMVYPNRSHGIYEGQNTSRHLYTLITNYLLEHNK